MNLKQAEIILEKITRLYKTMKIDERNIDVFEQDLMLSYIRQLYDSFAPDQPIAKRIKPVLPPVEEPPAPVVKETPKVAPAPKPVVPAVPKVAIPPKVVEQAKIVDPPKVVETPKPAPAPPKPQPASPPKGLSPAQRASLFEDKEATELSEKLSQAPIKDLSKSMGLNEKIFTINELFGGESKVFDETIKKLNSFKDFNEAREYLSEGVAHTYDWTSRSRKKKALNFIQLVKRRYN